MKIFDFNRLSANIPKFRASNLSFLILSEEKNGKKRLDTKKLLAVGLVITITLCTVNFLSTRDKDTSFLIKTTKENKQEEPVIEKMDSKAPSPTPTVLPKGIKSTDDTNVKSSIHKTGRTGNSMSYPASYTPDKNVKYFAKQVILREDIADSSNSLPTGTNFVGELLTEIDTRNPSQLIKVSLPYGGAYKGRILIPENSILLGTAKYPGDGEKAFLTFAGGIYPDGKEFQINAQALNSKDFTPGLYGNYHGTFTKRMIATLGLTFAAGATDVMQEKEALGDGSTVTTKSSFKNAMYAGTSKVAEMEAARQAGQMQSETPYITIPSGSDLLVSIITTFIKKE